jgi:hypothetical protein
MGNSIPERDRICRINKKGEGMGKKHEPKSEQEAVKRRKRIANAWNAWILSGRNRDLQYILNLLWPSNAQRG